VKVKAMLVVANPYAAFRADPAGWTRFDPHIGSSDVIFSSEALLRTQITRLAANDAIEFGELDPEVAEAAVRAVQEAAKRGRRLLR
jgi:hypothetical protein